MSSIFNGINEAARSPEPDYNDPSWDEKVSNVGQKAKQAEVLKSKGKEPKTRWNPETKKYYVDFSDVDESVGLPYPGTYEETNDMFKGSGQRRIGTLTTEEGVEGGSKEIPQWKKDWYAKQKPNSWPKHPQPYHNPNWIAELSPEQLRKIAGQKSVAEGDDPFRGTGGRFNRGDDERHDLDPTDWYIVKDGKMFAASIYPRQVQQAIAQGFSRTKQEARAKASSEGVAEGSQEDAKFTPRFEVRSRIEGALDQYLDPEQVAGGYTDIQYYKHDGRVYVEVLFNYTNGQKIGPTQRKRFLVNKDFTLTPIKRQQGVAEALTYPQKHSSWSVRSPKKNEFNTRYKLDQEPEARAHAERIGGKLVKVDQRGHAIRTGSKGDKGVAEGAQKWYPDAPVNDYAGHEYHKLSDDELERKRADQKERHEKLGDTKAGKNAAIARGIQVHRVRQGVAEGYSLKKTNVDKYMEPGDPDEYTQDINIKDTDYKIINNKTGQIVGTASWTTNDYFGPGALEITMKNGATRYLDIWEREKGNPQTAFNRFVKDPKTAKKYKEQGVAEARDGDTNFGHTVTRGSWVVHDGNKVKRFNTHNGAKAYAEKNGGKVASSEFYADKIKGKQDVAEGSLEEVSQDTARSYAQKAQASQKDLINQTYRKGADTDALNKKIKNRQQGMDRAHTDKRYYKDEQGVDEEKQRLDPKCWTGKHKEGTKMKGGVRVNNCVPNESSIMKGIKV